MYNDDVLRKRVKLLKALQDVKYTDLANQLGIKRTSLCNWLKEQYNFSAERERQLVKILDEWESKTQ